MSETLTGRRRILLLLLVTLLLLGCLPTVEPQPGGPEMRIIALDVGQGDAILIVSPNRETMLVDGGNSAEDATQVILPYLEQHGFDRLNVMVLTHPDADHVGGLPTILRAIDVGAVVATGQVHTTEIYAEFLRELQRARDEQDTEIVRGVAGAEVPFDSSVQVEVLAPDVQAVAGSDMNNASIVLRLTYEAVSILLAGDAEGPEESWILEQETDVSAAVIKISHHGSANGSGEAFLRAVAPDLALISCGAGNRYGHPDAAVLNRLDRQGVDIYRTDQQGTIEVVTDGGDVWVETER